MTSWKDIVKNYNRYGLHSVERSFQGFYFKMKKATAWPHRGGISCTMDPRHNFHYHACWDGVTRSLTHLIRSGSASHMLMKNRLLDASRTNYTLKYTHWNKVGLSFFTFSEVLRDVDFSISRIKQWTQPWTLTHWNWQGCFHAVSNWFWGFDITRSALL